MSYTPPSNDAVNFSEEGSYSPPSKDAVNFSEKADNTIRASPLELTLDLPEPKVRSDVISASPLQLSLDLKEPAVGGQVVASPLQLTLGLPDPSVGGQVVADPLSLSFGLPDPALSADSASFSASPLELSLGLPEPTVSASIPASPLELSLGLPDPVVGPTAWQVAGYPFEADTVESDAKTITLSAVLARYRLKQIRNIRRDAEKVGVVIDDEGRFRAVDRSLDGNTYTVTPPVAEDPPHKEADMLVAGYNESRAAKQENKKNVEVTLQRPESRDATGGEPSETAGSSEWLFEFHSGTIATDRVTPEQETVVDVAEDVESLQLVLTAEQVLVLETSATYPDAVSVVEIPDGQNLAEDNSSADRQTVTVTAPSPAKEDVLATGDYVVADWTSTRLDSDSYEVSLSLRPKA
jgi:hypothetical protein